MRAAWLQPAGAPAPLARCASAAGPPTTLTSDACSCCTRLNMSSMPRLMAACTMLRWLNMAVASVWYRPWYSASTEVRR
jgi:hypothetical protein